MTRSPSSFFRDVMPFEELRTSVLPHLIEARASERSLRFLSAVCSSGQEPYSIALTLVKHFPQLADWNVEIVGLDPSAELIEEARGGAYDQLVVQRGLPAMLLVKYFERRGHQWAIKDPPMGWVSFEQFDITSSSYPQGPFDVVFLANVLAHVDVDSHAGILDTVAHTMAADGYFFVGHTEADFVASSQFERTDDAQSPLFRLRS